jgi:outer membrane lipase/esterase
MSHEARSGTRWLGEGDTKMATPTSTSCSERAAADVTVSPTRRSRQNRDPAPSCAAARIAIAALSFAALGLATASEVRAAAQTWTFTVSQTITVNGNPLTFPTPPVSVDVQSTGSFQFTAVISPQAGCLPGGSVGISGGLSTALTFTASGSACGGTVSGSGSGPLDAPFPSATRTTSPATGSGTFTIPGLPPSTATFTVSGTCTSGCAPQPPPGPSPQQVAQATAAVAQAATLGNVAVITTGVQTTNIGLRLATLRRGMMGVAMTGLTLNVDGKSVPVDAVASLIPSLGGGGGASADRSSLLSRLGIFATGQGSFGAQDTTSGEPGYDFHTTGITLGVDYRFIDQLVLGVAFGYLHTKAAYDASAGDSAANGYNLSGYGTYYIVDRLYVDTIVTGGWNTYNSERSIPNVTATANSNTSGAQFSVSVGTGYNFNLGAFGFGPAARVNYIHVHIDGYQESGASPFNVSVGPQTIQSLTTDFGGQATYAISMPWGVLAPLLRLEWEHQYLGNSRTVTGSLVASPSTVVANQTASPDRDYLRLGAGLSATFRRGVAAFLDFDTVLGQSGFSNYGFNAGVRFEF